MQTGNFHLVREINRRLIFGLIRESGEISRARLVQVTELSKATVSAVVDELIGSGLIIEGATASGSVGRRPILLRLNPDGPYLGAIQVQSDRVLGALTDPQGRVVERVEYDCRAANGQSTIRSVLGALASIGAKAGAAKRAILGVGVSVPGILNPLGDVVLSAPVLGWRDVSLRRILQETVGFPVWLGDEAKMAALAEATIGAGRGAEVVLYLGSGSTVSAGLVRHGRLAPGTHAGHLTILPEGPPCWCGNRGCLETLVGEEGLRRRIRELGAAPGPSASEWLAERRKSDDVVARQVLAEVGQWMGIGVANMVSLFQPELVLIGGWLGADGEILTAIGDAVRRRALPAVVGPVRIAPGSVGDDAVLAGAAAMALEGALGSQPQLDLS